MKTFTKFIVCIFFIMYESSFAQLQTPKREDKPLERLNFELERVRDPKTGVIPIDELVKAHVQIKNKFNNNPKVAISGLTWFERGPNNIGGRTRAMMMDPNDVTNKRVWAGGVAGGVWYNNDITSAVSGWTKINDFWDNLAISCITYSPANTSVFYAGTGEGWFNSDAVQGGGIWKTADGGTTWNVLNATIPTYSTPTIQQFAFQTIQKIVVNPAGKVFAATQYGVWQSSDNGTTWTLSHAPSATISNAANFCSDLEYVGGVLYAGFGRGTGSSVRKSIDNGTTWTDITPPSITGGRTELAIGNAGTIYAVSDDSFSTISYFKKSVNGGTTWTNVTNPTDASLTTDVTNGQAWYDLILAVHPTNDNLVFIGGASHARSTDGGTTWFCFPYSNPVHPDHHNMIFRTGSTNQMIMANDGGVYYSTNYGDASITASALAFSFSSRNKDYNVMQPYSVAMKNTVNDGYILQGNQDNGTTYITSDYNTLGGGIEAFGGDGMLCFIDQNEPNIIIGSLQYKQHYTINPTTNTASYYLADPDADEDGNTDGQFLNPCDYDHTNNIFYSNVNPRDAAGNPAFSRTVVTAYNILTENLVNVTTSITDMNLAVIKASPYTAHTIYFGTTEGRLWKVIGMNTSSPVATQLVQKSGGISCIEIGATDNELILTLSNYNITSVWYSNDGGVNWVDKDASGHGLPNIPVRYALFNPLDRKQVLLATELGVWSTTDITASNPDWQPTNANLANVRCDMLRYRSADNTVAVATHGRGIFTTKLTSCPTNVVKTGNMSGTETVLSGTYINGKTTNVIQTGANTTYSAKNYVLLEPKFETQSGAIFKALIGGCN
jgi:hypothetical protein